MWSRIKNIVGTKCDSSNLSTEELNIANTLIHVPLLTSESERCVTPLTCNVPLWPHQEAMLARCKHIEAHPFYATTTVRNIDRYQDQKQAPTIDKVPIGVMCDPPGSGKTYAILSLIATDEIQGLNIIIVPQNIYHQWDTSIRTLFSDNENIKYMCCNQYCNISKLYDSPEEMESYNILLINDIYAEALAMTIYDNNIKVKRLIIDEIDIVQDRMSTPIDAGFLWLVSASFVHKEDTFVGPYKIATNDIPGIFCKCNPSFICSKLTFEEPIVTQIPCQDNEIALFNDFIGKNIINDLHACDKRSLYKLIGINTNPKLHTMSDLALLLIDIWEKRKVTRDEYEEVLKTRDVSEEEIMVINEKIKQINADLWHANLLRDRVKKFMPSEIGQTKMELFESEIVTQIKAEKNQKWLIFNDNANVLFEIYGLLKNKQIKCMLLDGGSADAISRAIQSYKEGNIQVLLLNSRMEGAGMNLENTSHLLFMHACAPELVEQIVGRAQRFGRIGPLHIYALLNKSEIQ